MSAVMEELGLGHPDEDMKASVAVASGSDDTRSYLPAKVSSISADIADREITVLDAIRALHQRGFEEEAENLLFLVKLRLSGDYLQTWPSSGTARSSPPSMIQIAMTVRGPDIA